MRSDITKKIISETSKKIIEKVKDYANNLINQPMKNMIENKAKFFAQYWGQKILFREGDSSPLYTIDEKNFFNMVEYGMLPTCNLLLTPLSQITDEDAIAMGNYLGWVYPNLYKKHLLEEHPYGHSLEQMELDFLRSKGYALPYMGLSVEQQIEYNWIKLKTV